MSNAERPNGLRRKEWEEKRNVDATFAEESIKKRKKNNMAVFLFAIKMLIIHVLLQSYFNEKLFFLHQIRAYIRGTGNGVLSGLFFIIYLYSFLAVKLRQ